MANMYGIALPNPPLYDVRSKERGPNRGRKFGISAHLFEKAPSVMNMKILGSGLCVAMSCALAADTQGAADGQQRILKVLVLKDSPLSHRDWKGNFVGFNVDFGRLLCETIKMPCEFHEIESAKVVGSIANGEFDFTMVSLIVTPERAKQVLFTEPYRTSKTFWISQTPIGQSKQSRVAVVNGSMQHQWAERNKEKYGWTVAPMGFLPDLEKSLRDGRADAVISPSSTALDIMNSKDLGESLSARSIESDEFNNPVAIAVNPADKELCDRLNAALKKIKTNGQLDLINSRYYSVRLF